MSETEKVLADYHEWANEREELTNEDDVKSSDWHNSDDVAFDLLHRMAAQLQGGASVATDFTYQHLQRICREAGLEVMQGIFDVVWNREEIDEATLLLLTHEDVTHLYEHVGRAIDQIVDNLKGI